MVVASSKEERAGERPSASRGSFLVRLIHPMSLEDLSRSFPEHSFTCHGPLSRCPELAEIGALANVESLAAVGSEAVTVSALPEGVDAEPGPTRPEVAVSLYHAGALLQFNDVHHDVPELARIARSIDADLGLPLGSTRVQVFASKVGRGASAHWDNDPVLTVQLRGAKEWRFVATAFVRDPLDNYVCGTEGTQFEGYHAGALPSAMPTDAERITLSPGSALFLPRGCLHQTESKEASLSIGFDFIMPSFADLVAAWLTRRLHANASWRRYAPSIPAIEHGAFDAFGAMKSELHAAVADLIADPHRLADEMDPPLSFGGPRVWRREAVPLALETRGRLPVLVVGSAGGGQSEIEITPEFVPLARWLLEQPDRLTAREARLQGASLSDAELATFVRALEAAGALTRAD